jgi:hypothetical protein
MFMRKLLGKCWKDDAGALIAIEFLFVATILVIGTVVGLTAIRNAVNTELTELANAILSLNPSFTISGVSGCGASVDGSEATVTINLEPCPMQIAPTQPQTITCFPCQ